MICFLALVLHRVMRMRLKAAGVNASPETVLDTLAEIQRHRISSTSESTKETRPKPLSRNTFSAH